MEAQEITERALTVPDKAKAIIIVTNDDYVRAGEILLVIKDLRKEIDETFDPIIKKAHETHKEAVAQKKKVDAPLVEAENIIKPRISTYLDEQEKRRKAEEARLQEIAREEEEDRKLQEAILAEQAGDKEEAEAIIQERVYVAPVIVPKSVPKIAGISTRTNWKFRIIDIAKIPREYMMPDEKTIGAVVRASEGKIKIPGVEAYPDKGVAAGRR